VAPSGDCARVIAYIILSGDCHIQQQSQRKLCKSSTFAIRQAAARLSPSGGTTFQTPFFPVSFGKSFKKIRSAVPENGGLIFFGRKKTSVKHIRYRLISGCANNQ